MDWGQAGNIIWLLSVPIFIGLSIYVYRWRNSAREKFADSNLIEKLFPTQSNTKYWTTVILMSLALLFAVLALMEPKFGQEDVKIKREGIDIVYALDLSNSMYAEDVVPNRLEKAKKILLESTQRLGGDRVGLMVFAADAYTISPLTHDYNAIQAYVETASPELITYQGTNFSAVLDEAVEMFGKLPTTAKLLVIISDGEDNEESLRKAIRVAEENTINIVTIGIGTRSGAPIPMESNYFSDFKIDRSGNIVISKLNETTMQSLAESADGIYIHGEHNNQTLDQLHDYLNQMEKNVQEEDYKQDKKHVFQWFLAFALLFIFIDTLTSEHKLFNNKK